MAQSASGDRQVVALNRKARRNYHIEQAFETGIVLTGTEVKSMRKGGANLGDSYAAERNGEIFLMNAHISEYDSGSHYNHEPRRPRKLLLKRREIRKLIGTLRKGGVTLVPLSLYFNPRGRAKVELALATGKKQYDKRADEKARDWRRQKERIMRARN